MDDRQLWDSGAVRLKGLLADLPGEDGLKLTRLLTRYRKTKEAIAAVVEEVGAAFVCLECAGQCCLNGKYRINGFDAMAHVKAGMTLPANFNQKPLCPYGTVAGCSMEPGLRPADCILFICDAIDGKLPPQDRSLLTAHEQDLRECIRKASRLTGEQLGTPLLLWAGQDGEKNKSKV